MNPQIVRAEIMFEEAYAILDLDARQAQLMHVYEVLEQTEGFNRRIVAAIDASIRDAVIRKIKEPDLVKEITTHPAW